MSQSRLYPAISLLSISVIAFQLALMQMLSLMQWSHFAYLVISIALLGFGASGTVISLFRIWLMKRAEIIIPLMMISSGLFMALNGLFTKTLLSGFDSFLLFNQPQQISKLFLACLIFMLPFFFAGSALGLIYTVQAQRIGKLYFADLAGSGLGGVLFTVLLWILFPEQIIYIIAFLPLLSGLLASKKAHIKIHSGFTLFTATLVLLSTTGKKNLPVSEFKSLEKTLAMQGSQILYEASSPYGHMHVVSAPSLRYAPGLSLAWQEPLPPSLAMFSNGDWFGAIPTGESPDKFRFLDYTLYALPFTISAPQSVLVLDAGTGTAGAYSLAKGSRIITLVEPNAAAISLMKNELAEVHDFLLYQTDIRVKQMHPRSYLLSDSLMYDLIYLPDAGSFGGTAGMLAAGENFLFTDESFNNAWNRLNYKGFIMISAWMDYPSRVSLRLLSLISSTLKAQGISHPETHLTIVRSWAAIGFLVKKSPFTNAEKDQVLAFCQKTFFDPMVTGEIHTDEASVFNFLQDEQLTAMVDTILRGDMSSFIRNYSFDISPPTDNNPFFYRFIKPSEIKALRHTYSWQELFYMEPGYFITFLVFGVILLLSLALIFLPMLFYRLKKGGIGFVLVYFGGLGIGFMFLEIVFIQQFILYLGEPIYSAAAVLIGILIFSGAGSYFSSGIKINRKPLIIVFSVLLTVILFYTIGLKGIMRNSVHLGMEIKTIVSFLLIAPPSFFMGMAFPIGIRIISSVNESLVPWAWGVNGYLSVLSAVLAILISIHAGFTAVLLLAALAYFLAMLAAVFLHPHKLSL